MMFVSSIGRLFTNKDILRVKSWLAKAEPSLRERRSVSNHFLMTF